MPTYLLPIQLYVFIFTASLPASQPANQQASQPGAEVGDQTQAWQLEGGEENLE